MGLFDRFKGKKTVDWSAAYTAEPKFYGRPDGTPFGAIALTEGTETVLPTAPQAAYQVDGQPVAAWRMVIVSTTRGGVIGDADYFAALEKAAPYRLDGRADAVLLRGLTAEELEGLPGIGPTLAQRILDYRRENGDFTSVEELMQVEGIGQARLEALRDYITVEARP